MLARTEAALDDFLVRLQGVAHERGRLTRVDGLLALACGLAAVGVAAWAAQQVGDAPHTEGSFGLWFQADNPRVLANLVDAHSNQYRANVHPLFPILLTPWVSLLGGLPPSPVFWAKAVVFLFAGTSAGLVFLALRLIRLALVPALVFTALFVSSAAFLHWYSVIETAPFNGLSTCVAVLALCYGPTRRRLWWVLMSVFTLSMTVTNWSAGLAATIARWRLREAVIISAVALALAGVLCVGQRLIYPTAGVFFNPLGILREKQYAAPETPGWSPPANVRSALVYTVVTPRPTLETRDTVAFVSNQEQGFDDLEPVGMVAAVVWMLLLAGGTVGAARAKDLRPVAFGLGLMLIAQLLVDIAYGDLTFLYATNILPMLVLLAAFTWTLPGRWAGVALALVVVIAGGLNNAQQMSRAGGLAQGVIAAGGNRVWDRYSAKDGYVLPVRPAGRAAP